MCLMYLSSLFAVSTKHKGTVSHKAMTTVGVDAARPARVDALRVPSYAYHYPSFKRVQLAAVKHVRNQYLDTSSILLKFFFLLLMLFALWLSFVSIMLLFHSQSTLLFSSSFNQDRIGIWSISRIWTWTDCLNTATNRGYHGFCLS